MDVLFSCFSFKKIAALFGSYFLGIFKMVGAKGFEPSTPCPPDKCATRLRHAPTQLYNLFNYIQNIFKLVFELTQGVGQFLFFAVIRDESLIRFPA